MSIFLTGAVGAAAATEAIQNTEGAEAAVDIASIYHRFQDAGSFMREISKFLEEK